MDAVFDVNAILVSKTAWERLPQKLQQTAEDTFQETLEWIFKESYRVNVQARQKLLDKGMELIIPDEAEINLWKEAAAPFIVPYKTTASIRALFRRRSGIMLNEDSDKLFPALVSAFPQSDIIIFSPQGFISHSLRRLYILDPSNFTTKESISVITVENLEYYLISLYLPDSARLLMVLQAQEYESRASTLAMVLSLEQALFLVEQQPNCCPSRVLPFYQSASDRIHAGRTIPVFLPGKRAAYRSDDSPSGVHHSAHLFAGGPSQEE